MFRGSDGTAVRRPAGGTSIEAVTGVLAAARTRPAEVFTVAVYLVSGIIGQIVFVWVVGAVLLVLSEVWSRFDKRVAVGIPLVATLIGMTLWRGEAPYIDQIILNSLMDTGVIGLRLAAVGCAVYLTVRITRITRSADI